MNVSQIPDAAPSEVIKVRYNECNTQDYYEEGATLDKKGMIWYIAKVVAIILLTILFFNKELLSKIGLRVTAE